MRAWLFILGLGCSTEKNDIQAQDTGSVTDGLCPVTLTYETDSGPDGVLLAGSFNDWTPAQTPLSEVKRGVWAITLQLAPGEYPYKFVETITWSQGHGELWTCDSKNPLIHCEEGTAADLDWTQECEAGNPSCNSLLMVEDCQRTRVHVAQVQADRTAGTVAIDLVAQTSEDPTSVRVDVDDTPATYSEQTGMFHVELGPLGAEKTVLDVTVSSDSGPGDGVTIPLNMDDWSWERAVIYHAMIDRVANGQEANDSLEGTTHAITDYAGGDLSGLEAALPYLDDLGINTLWLSNPQAGPQGAWEGDCGATYSGYHGFWPTSWSKIDAHLGTKADLKSLIDAAHDRGMRVILDWVGNHVHDDHPILDQWPQTAIHDLAVCNDQGAGGALNWDLIPESCWFAPYLPDLDQSDPAVLASSIESAIEWAETYGLDGLRVDAAKHMPHSVSWNLQSEVRNRLEHSGADFDFMLIGETFDGADAINAFIGPDQLDGQFDFPLYWQLRDAFIYDSASLADVVDAASRLSERYPGGQMSTFLGNLDVSRFITTASEWSDNVCQDGALRQASAPTGDEPYDRLLMAWAFLFSQPGMPLIYYGDEMGLPGYGDPDNRQPLWWTANVMDGDVESVAAQLDSGPARVLHGVKALTQARASISALATGTTTEWWSDGPDLYAYSRSDENGGALVILSRKSSEYTVNNGLSFAGLPPGAVFEDVLTGDRFYADGDNLSISMPPMSARLLRPTSN